MNTTDQNPPDSAYVKIEEFEKQNECSRPETLKLIREGVLCRRDVGGIHVAWKDTENHPTPQALRKEILRKDANENDIKQTKGKYHTDLSINGPFEFKVYKHKELGYEAIKQGFSWPGFFFTWIWALVKKLWVHGLVLFVIVPALNTVGFTLLEGNSLGIILGLIFIFLPSFIVGMKGNYWREESMSQRGYEFIASVEANTADGALANINEVKTNAADSVLAKTNNADADQSNNSDQSVETKECPMCAENIKAKARICRYCGYEFKS